MGLLVQLLVQCAVVLVVTSDPRRLSPIRTGLFTDTSVPIIPTQNIIVAPQPYPITTKQRTTEPPHYQSWSETTIACIRDHNNKELLNTTTFEVCKEKCEKETDFVCRSIDYWPQDRECDLSTSISTSESYIQPCYSPYESNLYAERIFGLSNFDPDKNQCSMTAKEIVMLTSGASATHGILISLVNEEIFKKRRQGIDVLEDIELLGSDIADHFFSREFEEKTSNDDFLKVVDIFGTQIATKANYEGLFVKAGGGVTVNYDKEQSTEQKTKSHNKYVSAIKVYNVPIKSIDLDPRYIRLNQGVLIELTEIEKKISINTEDQTILFNEYFKNYGSHFIFGLMELGGSIIIKSEATFSSNSNFKEYKETVKRAVDAYADLSVTAGGRSGGGSVKTNANELKDEISGSSSEEILKNISLEREKIGGPVDDEIDLWKKGLAEQCETWRIIDKPTNLITTWDLIMLHHANNFTNAKHFTSQMNKAWETIIEKELLDLTTEFKNLASLSPATAERRRELIIKMMSEGPVVGVKDNKKSTLGNFTSGQVILPALQLQEKPLDPDTTTILPFDSIQFLPERPYKVFLRLEHNNQYLGDIIILLNGTYPKWEKQFLELSTGDNNVGGAWRGAGFNMLNQPGENGELLGCPGYRNASGLQRGSLFKVENDNPFIHAVAGTVFGDSVFGDVNQKSGFFILTIRTKSVKIEEPYIGHVTSGLDLLQRVASRGDDFVKGITFSDCGLVVID